MKTFTTFALSVLVAGVALAGPGPGRGERGFGPGGLGPGKGFGPGGGHMAEGLMGRMGERIADLLDLTEEQRAEAKALGEALRADLQPLRESMGPLHDSLRAALDANPADPSTVGGIVIQIEGVRDQIHAKVEQFEADFEALLTPEQLEIWERIQAHRDERREGRPGRG